MNGTNYKIKYRYSGEQEWHYGYYTYDTTPLTEVQSLAQQMIDKSENKIEETVVEAINPDYSVIEVSRHTKKKTKICKPRKKRPRKCPWCKNRATTKKHEDGYWYCGCFDGFCPVSPSTSGQETEEEAIETWNSYKIS